MEINLNKDKALKHFDSGGGYREIQAMINIADNLTPRMQRHIVIYETLGCLLDYILSHQQIDEITDKLVDSLDQLDAMNG